MGMDRQRPMPVGYAVSRRTEAGWSCSAKRGPECPSDPARVSTQICTSCSAPRAPECPSDPAFASSHIRVGTCLHDVHARRVRGPSRAMGRSHVCHHIRVHDTCARVRRQWFPLRCVPTPQRRVGKGARILRCGASSVTFTDSVNRSNESHYRQFRNATDEYFCPHATTQAL